MFTIKWKVLDPVPRVLFFQSGYRLKFLPTPPARGLLRITPFRRVYLEGGSSGLPQVSSFQFGSVGRRFKALPFGLASVARVFTRAESYSLHTESIALFLGNFVAFMN